MSSSPKSLPIKSFIVSNRTQISATNLNSSLEFSSQCNIPPPRTNSPPKTTMSSNLFVLPARFCVSPFVSNQTLTSDLSSSENCVNTSTPLSTNCFDSVTVNSESPVSHTETLSLTTRPTVFSGVSPIADFHEMSTRPDANSMDLASLFECPVCTDFALPPIMQCQSGHIVCLTCRAKLSSCPTCRGNLENIRNLAMEKLAASVLFPCKYSVTGCSETFHYTTKSEHEAICAYRPYICPCPGASCKWLGQLEHVMSHLMQSHKSITTLQGEDIVFLATDITLPGAVDWVMMQSCFGHHFMLVLEKQEHLSHQLFYALVLLIGTKKMAENFVYRLDLTAPTRRLTWESTPHNIHDGVQAAISVSDCLVFNANQAQLFSENGSLGINVTISKVRTS